MKSKGNSDPVLCAMNLLSFRAGEIPLDRMRGLPADLIDRPVSESRLRSEARWLLKNYEPRVSLNSVSADVGLGGKVEIKLDVSVIGE